MSLGRFDPIELPIILDVLRERGIFATTKAPLEEAEANPYPGLAGHSREILLVERTRSGEARALIETEVPALIEQMREDLGPTEPGSPEDEGLAPLGWLEPEVARELIARLADAGILAEPEYPLDAPPPPYARSDGRVRVHVERSLRDEAADVLSTEVRDALAARGITPSEPLLGEDT